MWIDHPKIEGEFIIYKNEGDFTIYKIEGEFIIYKYSKTYIKRSPLGQRKNVLIRQVTY